MKKKTSFIYLIYLSRKGGLDSDNRQHNCRVFQFNSIQFKQRERDMDFGVGGCLNLKSFHISRAGDGFFIHFEFHQIPFTYLLLLYKNTNLFMSHLNFVNYWFSSQS